MVVAEPTVRDHAPARSREADPCRDPSHELCCVIVLTAFRDLYSKTFFVTLSLQKIRIWLDLFVLNRRHKLPCGPVFVG